ncbi:hypothetical protein PIROE2DRAFT_4064 [Piromyces sp. E2]|nr:hypothetical protein PIROE2DRAFT_4064 [Piromyces sp. E2]|eukprot:OUM68312.1 hypothetical protein PIROE2DRAFT_4064 [Piromyces sp. E2]
MESDINIELKKFYFEKETSICNVFKDALVKRIFESETLKDHCTIESCNGISVRVNMDGTILKFTNGHLELKEEGNGEKEEKVQKISEDVDKDINELSTLIIEETEKIKNRMVYALSLNENMNNLGYCMDEKMLNTVATLDVSDVEKLSNELIPLLKVIVGDDVVYHPFYPNFPSQVIQMKYWDLYFNALKHYWSRGTYYPYTKEEERPTSVIEVKYKNITIGKEEDLHAIMTNLMSAAEAISSQDIDDLTTYFSNYENFMDNVPEVIPNKENLAIVTNLILTYCKEPPMDKISRRFTTVIDVLKLAAVMSGGSATLSEKVRFKSFSNKERRFIMSLLNNCQNRLDDFYVHRNMWERVCERIHPSKFKKIYPDLVEDLNGSYRFKKEIKNIVKQIQSYDALLTINKNEKKWSVKKKNVENALEELKKGKLSDEIKENIKIFEQYFNGNNKKQLSSNNHETSTSDELKCEKVFEQKRQELENKLTLVKKELTEYKNTHQRYATKVEKFLDQGYDHDALELLCQRPGVFSRRLDELLNRVKDHNQLINIFETIANKVSVKVLLSLKGYFQKRNEKLKVRVFLIKGKNSMYFKRKVKNSLDIELCDKICQICDKALMNHFEGKEKLNKVYISKDFHKYIIPMDVRTSNSSLETYSKGSRFDFSYKQLTMKEQEMVIKDKEDDLVKKKSRLEQLKQNITNENEKMDLDKTKLDSEMFEKEIQKLEKEIESDQQNIEKDKTALDMEKGTNVRLFIWWTNNEDQVVDIDLSVMIYDENLRSRVYVSFSEMKSDYYEIYHSGDIVNGGDINGDGEAEFIDLDPDYIIGMGARYIAVSVISYNEIPFKNIKNCKFGWMEREDLESNELFEPKTVRQCLDIKSDCIFTVPVVFDCQTREFIWVDTALTQKKCCINIENSRNPMNGILYYYLDPLKVNLYDLVNLHIQARNGQRVEFMEELSEGDTAFVSSLPYKCVEGVTYIRPTDLDIILSEYMTSAC